MRSALYSTFKQSQRRKSRKIEKILKNGRSWLPEQGAEQGSGTQLIVNTKITKQQTNKRRNQRKYSLTLDLSLMIISMINSINGQCNRRTGPLFEEDSDIILRSKKYSKIMQMIRTDIKVSREIAKIFKNPFDHNRAFKLSF